MINRYSMWRNLLLLSILAVGFVYVMPNFYQPDAAIQIVSESSSQEVGDEPVNKVREALLGAGVSIIGEEQSERGVVIRIQQRNRQLQARQLAQDVLGAGYVVALNLATTVPAWLQAIGAGTLKLGLDLSGGVHFLLEVDSESYIQTRMSNFSEDLRRSLREERIIHKVTFDSDTELIRAVFATEELRQRAELLVEENLPELVVEKQVSGGEYILELILPDQTRTEFINYAVEQNLTILRNRVNELGVSEPLVQRQGRHRIVVELPGVQDTAQAKRILGKFANLEFRLEARSADSSFSRERFRFRNEESVGQRSAWLQREIIVKGENVTGARSGFDQNSRPMVSISLDSQGGARMNQITRDSVGRSMGVLFIERRTRTRETRDSAAYKVEVGEKYEDRKLISLATIRSALGTNFQIEGLSSVSESIELALLLRAGALSAPLDFVEERTVGPSLGAENIRLGIRSVLAGMALVLLFMLFWFRGFGMAADIALLLNLMLLLSIMSLLSATLTLPGIAGIVLTVGMAVDANVLIFSRIREEFKSGLSPQQAIHSGFERAIVTILDANITTLIVALILYIIGTGPVKGFAVTLSIGIITSMFTAILITRAIVNLVYGGRRLSTLRIGWEMAKEKGLG